MESDRDLHGAVLVGDFERVKVLLEEGVDLDVFDDWALTPLHRAVYGGHLEIAGALIAAGADVNAHDEAQIGDTPLGQAAGECSYEMAKLLIQAGADPTIKGWMHLCALDRARERKYEEGRRVYDLLEKAALRFQHKK